LIVGFSIFKKMLGIAVIKQDFLIMLQT
jgi:hypothetical protein